VKTFTIQIRVQGLSAHTEASLENGLKKAVKALGLILGTIAVIEESEAMVRERPFK